MFITKYFMDSFQLRLFYALWQWKNSRMRISILIMNIKLYKIYRYLENFYYLSYFSDTCKAATSFTFL